MCHGHSREVSDEECLVSPGRHASALQKGRKASDVKVRLAKYLPVIWLPEDCVADHLRNARNRSIV